MLILRESSKVICTVHITHSKELKSICMKIVGLVVRMDEGRNAFKILPGKPKKRNF